MKVGFRITRMLCLLAMLGGCMAWETPAVAPATLISRDQPGAVRVTRQDGSRVIVYQPVVDADSLRGRQRRGTITLSLSDMSRLEVQKTQAAATVAGLTLTAAAIGAMIMVSTVQIGF